MDRTYSMVFKSIEEILRCYNAETKKEEYHIDKLKRYAKQWKKHFGQCYVDKLANVRKNEENKKVVTSVAIHEHNQKFIQQLQSEAKKHYFTLSKENIINLALYSLEEEFLDLDCDVTELVDYFY